MTYVGYNQMYHKGKKVGRPFKNVELKTKKGVLNTSKRINAQWNKLERKSGSKVKLAFVRKKK